MIKLTEGGFSDMWNGAPTKAKCISYAIQKVGEDLLQTAATTMCASLIDRLEEEILDYLAVELRAMYYDQSLPIESKRELIRGAYSAWYMKAGTPAAVGELVQTVFGEGEVVEWFDTEASPYTFDIVTNAPLTENILDDFERIISRVKNQRSHLRRVLVNRTHSSDGRIAACALTWPHQEKIVIKS